MRESRRIQAPNTQGETWTKRQTLPYSFLAAEDLVSTRRKSYPKRFHADAGAEADDGRLLASPGTRQDCLFLRREDRQYQLCPLGSQGKIRLQIQRKDELFLDILNLFSASQRTTFARSAARRLLLAPRFIEADLYQIVSLLEARHPQAAHPLPLGAQLRSAEEWLNQADLLARLLVALRRSGLDQTDAVNLLAFLLPLTRHTAQPQSLCLVGSSSPKRISFLSALLSLMPQEAILAPTFSNKARPMFALSARDKLLLLPPESPGKTLKRHLLQIRLATAFASLQTHEDGQEFASACWSTGMPALLTSTASAMDLIGEELLLLPLAKDPPSAQFNPGWHHHTSQAGKLQERQMETMRLLQNAQRLLQPRLIHNPFAEMQNLPCAIPQRPFLQDLYFSLIDAVTLLHQRQRHTRPAEASQLPVVESNTKDLAVVDQLFLLAVLPAFLPHKSRELLERLTDATPSLPEETEDWSLPRLREQLGWSETALRTHLQRLVHFAFLRLISSPGSRPARFRLNASPHSLSLLLTKAQAEPPYTSFFARPSPPLSTSLGDQEAPHEIL